jgi:cyclopropane fatty-acyl-phospholipid synthase-like methyltransferase
MSGKPHAPACERNRDPILDVLRTHFADCQRVLEVGSGTGQHAVHFAAAMPWLTWQCSDVAEQLPGISLWLDGAQLANTPPPIELDVRGAWPSQSFDAVFSANTLHIMAWPEVETFFAGVGQILQRAPQGGVLAVYGPFNYRGAYSSDSNREFDEWLRARDPRSGIRDFESVDALARGIGLQRVADVAMPANNRTLVWRR